MKLRTIEVLHDGVWTSVPSLDQVKVGETLRMFEPDGEPVVGTDGVARFRATGKAERSKNERHEPCWRIPCEVV